MTKAAIGWTVVLIMAATGVAMAQTPTPTPSGPCCETHLEPGCNLDACRACVCLDLEEPLCCSDGGDGWDNICVALASSEDCSEECSCGGDPPTPTPTPGGDCCSVHAGSSCDEAPCSSCVCDIDPICCTGSWDATCVSIARTAGECAEQCTTCTPLPTEPPDSTPTPGPCCEGRDLNPGCDDNPCESCVCGVDPVCCSDTWDDSCVVIAAEECALDCFCPDDGDCCEPHDGLGCDDRRCQDCVLGLDVTCGDIWDESCADQAAAECALDCTCGDCCADQVDVPGCGDKFCQDCVCALDPACCDPEEGWDDRCVDISVNECSIACPCGDCCVAQEPDSEIVGCGDKECQDCVCALDANCCETEWDGICAARANAECERRCETCSAVSNCCTPREGEAGCEVTACEECVCAIDDFCCTNFWDPGCATELTVTPECAAICMCGDLPIADCPGDCNADGEVAINELIQCVNISLGNLDLSACPACDPNGDGTVAINELIQAVNAALSGCPELALLSSTSPGR